MHMHTEQPSMVQNLIVLDSAYNGSRDICWTNLSEKDVVGYNIYRAFDSPTAWALLNSGNPLPIPFYRDQTTYQTVTYTVQPADWVSFGGDGSYVFKIPTAPIWSTPVPKRHPTVANNPGDVQLTIDGEFVPVARVDGQEALIYIQQYGLSGEGSVTVLPTTDFVKNEITTRTVTITYYSLLNYVDIYLAGAAGTRTFYTVVPVMAGGYEAHKPGFFGTEVKTTYEIDSMDYMYAEMVRRNAFIFEQSGEPANLMIRRTKGTPCGCLIANGEPRTGCESCYETGIIGGYYGPYEILFIDPDVAAIRTINEGGVKVERASRSYLGPTPLIQAGDFIVRRNGERLVISDPVYKSPRGVLLQQDFNVNLLSPNDTRYLIPLVSPQPPSLPIQTYDPRFVEKRELPAEPLTNPTGHPDKQWDNKRKPEGRTVVFGNIET